MNFTLQDIAGVTLAFALFPFVLVFPGYVCGWTFDLFDFRSRRLLTRFAIAPLLSIAVCPILYYLVASLLSMNAALIMTFLFTGAFLMLLLREKPAFSIRTVPRALVGAALTWILIALISLIDLQLGAKELYFSVASYDHTTRVSIIDAMTRTGVPPINPSYYPHHPVKLTFLYFFWYILGSVIDIMGGSFVDARVALFASVIWCGLALMALIAFYLRLRDAKKNNGSRKKIWIAVALLAVTGLDLLPVLSFIQARASAVGDVEHWNEQITAWVGSLLWVPHHVAALVAALSGTLLAYVARDKPLKTRLIAFAFSGVAFASALGLSVWVTLIFVLFWALWAAALYAQKENRFLIFPMIFAGLVALILSGSFMLGLFSASADGANAFPIAPTIRAFSITDVAFDAPSIWKYFFRLISLPLNYFLELGFFMFAGFLWLKLNRTQICKNPYYLAETLILCVSFLLGTFARSTLIENNDLGWRAWLPGQFILLIWGADALDQLFLSPRKSFRFSPASKYWLLVLIALGVCSTALDLFSLRFFYQLTYGSEAGRVIYSAREAYSVINQTLPQNSIVQYNPADIINRPSGLYGMRQSVISDRTSYGVPLDEYNAKVAEVANLFNLTDVRNWDEPDALCKVNDINAIVLTERDRLWDSVEVLKNNRTPIYLDEHYAVFTCGG
ncbi:MAG: hypothetical protein HS124_04850 [Anaerolineales bacterium]|nr:hypothetical protein [Anaerolineales bacterium]MCL4260223.1 hypothetical protein [Anaerolineales bacterium]